MSRAAQYIRESFVEMFWWLSVVSLRSWVLVLLGPLFALLTTWIGRIPMLTAVIVGAPIVAIVIVAVIGDARRRPFGAWITKTAIGWAIVFIAASIVAVPKQNLHDELLLTQVAMEKISNGEDPYGADYRGTIVDLWTGHALHLSYVNGVYPGWDRYVYLPGFFVVSYPIYIVVHGLTGAYDQRIVYLMAYALLVFGSWWSLKRSPVREPLTLAFALNPFLMNVTYGFNDLLPVALLALTGFLLVRRKFIATAIVYGLALSTKQTMLLTLPFVLLALFRECRSYARSRTVVFAALSATVAAVMLPFLLWSPARFFDDTVRFFMSSTAYPIHGEGLSGLLIRAGAVTSTQYFPFWIFQAIGTIPLYVYFMRRARRTTSYQAPFFAAAVTIGAFWFLSRYFLTSHAHVIILLIILSFVIGEAQRSHEAQ